MAAHLGETDEYKINNMSYVWFNLVLAALGKKLNYESISNLYGNSFAKDAAKIVQSAYPLSKSGQGPGSGVMGLMGQIKIIDSTKNSAAAKKAEKDTFGDLSWAEGLK